MIDMTTWEQKSETTEFKSIAESYATVCSMWTGAPKPPKSGKVSKSSEDILKTFLHPPRHLESKSLGTGSGIYIFKKLPKFSDVVAMAGDP